MRYIMNNNIILFDLENTLIWDWIENRGLMSLRFPCIHEWIMSQPLFIAGVFSFAIWDETDLEEFNESGLREGIEKFHHLNFDDEWIFIRNNLLPDFRNFLKMPFLDTNDLFSFFDKQTIVERLWLEKWEPQGLNVTLLDDTVKDMKITRNDNTLEFVNPWTIIHEN